MTWLRIGAMALVLLAVPLLGGCITSAKPDVAPEDLLSLALTGDYEVVSPTDMFETGADRHIYRARIETSAPGSYRLTIAPPEGGKRKEPVVYDFRLLKGGKAHEYLAIHEMALGESQEKLTHYLLIRADGDSWSVNGVSPQGDLGRLLSAAQAVGLGMKLSGSLIELTGTLTGKAIVALFRNPDFAGQLALSESLRLRPLPGQGFSPYAEALIKELSAPGDGLRK